MESATRSQHADAVNALTDFRGVIINKADGMILVLRMLFHVANYHFPGVSGAINQHPFSLIRSGYFEFTINPPGKTDSNKKENEQKRIDEEHRTRISFRFE